MGGAGEEQQSLRRKARIIVLLDAARRAGISPIPLLSFHAFAYLANVLAPVWDMPVQDGKVLKRRGGPFYPELQRDLDRMTGTGMVTISEVTHLRTPEGRWRLEGKYDINTSLAGDALSFLLSLHEERRLSEFICELGYALSGLDPKEVERALIQDATYSDPSVSEDNVLDFSEWSIQNPSANAANYFDRLFPNNLGASQGEKLHLYVRHLRRRAHAQ